VVIRKTLLCCVSLGTLFTLGAAGAQGCPSEPAFYDAGDYTVRHITVSSPLDFLFFVHNAVLNSVSVLPLKSGKRFTASEYSEGVDSLRTSFAFSNVSSPFKLRLVVAHLLNCDDSTKQLDVAYTIFISDPSSYFAAKSQFLQDSSANPSNATENVTPGWKFRPSGGLAYNATRSFAPMLSISLNPKGDSSANLDSTIVESRQFHSEIFAFKKAWTRPLSTVSQLDLNGGYEHYDAPANTNSIKFGRLFAEVRGTAVPHALSNLTVHFGAQIQGGNEQSNIATGIPGYVASGAVTSIKGYVGAEFDSQDTTLTGSYASELGLTGIQGPLEFVKQVLNLLVVDHVRLPSTRNALFHRSLDLRLGLSGGLLNQYSSTPIPERFFGGNEVVPFIAQDPWVVNAAPYIRSIPENKFNGAVLSTLAFGGTSFTAMNLTVGMPVWGKSLIPQVISTDPDFRSGILAAENTAQTTLTLTNEKADPHFSNILGQLPALSDTLTAMKSALAGLPSVDATKVQVADALDKTNSTIRVLTAVQGSTPLEAPALFSGNTSKLSRLTLSLMTLNAALTGVPKTQFEGFLSTIQADQSALAGEYQKIDTAAANKKAAADLTSVKQVLNTLMNDLNLTAISPVLILDAARLWPSSANFRYGPGGGIKLSLVTLNVTVGYAANVKGTPLEGKGALVFSLDVSNAFR